jgi:hypothetical protein
VKPIAEIQHLSVDLTKQNLAKFKLLFSDDDTCMRLLSELKWKEGFTCSKCGHTNSCSGKSPYSRRCTRCKKEESATANTIFHHCRIPLRKAFEMAYLACTFPAISSYEISRQFEIRHMTCYNFKKKVLRCKEGGQVEKLFAKLIMEVNHRLGSDEIA